MGIADSIRNWLWKGATPLLDATSAQGEKVEADFAELKKLVRRQGIQQETLVRDLAAKIDTLPAALSPDKVALRPDSLMEVAESFFHLEAALLFAGGGAETREAIGMVWEKLDGLCRESALETVRQSGIAFDSRIHEAIDRAPDGESPTVQAVTTPGFLFEGRVVKPARVRLTMTTGNGLLKEQTHGS